MTGRSSGLTGDVTLSQLRCLDCCLVKLVLCQWFVKVRFSSAEPRCKQNVRTVKTVSNGGKTRNNKQQHKPEQEPVRRYKNRFKRLFNGDNNQQSLPEPLGCSATRVFPACNSPVTPRSSRPFLGTASEVGLTRQNAHQGHRKLPKHFLTNITSKI